MVFSFFCVLYRAGHGLEYVVALLQHKKSAPGFVGSRDVVPLKNVQSLLLGDNTGQLVTPALGPKYLWTENFIFRLTRKCNEHVTGVQNSTPSSFLLLTLTSSHLNYLTSTNKDWREYVSVTVLRVSL
jgi:hypothetical protein